MLPILLLIVIGCSDVQKNVLLSKEYKLGYRIKEEAKPYCLAKRLTQFKNNSSKYKEKIKNVKHTGTRTVSKKDGGMKCVSIVSPTLTMSCKPTYKKVKETYSYFKDIDVNRINRVQWFYTCMEKKMHKVS